MLELSERLADSTRHIQKTKGIRPHVSDRPPDQSTQPGHLSHLDFRYHSKVKKRRLRPV
jgi:hypothetical protein